MAGPDGFDDVDEAVAEEWVADTTAAERVRETVSHEYGGLTAADVADTVRTSTDKARGILDALVDDGFVRADTDVDGVTTYRRDPRSLVVEQATDILDEDSAGELTARVQDMQDRLEALQSDHGVESPEAAAELDDVDSESVREWKRVRRNLAVVNAAVSIREAERVVARDYW